MATAPKPTPLPESITRHAEFQAREEGITPEEWLARMTALRLDTEEGTRKFFRLRSANAVRGAWRTALAARPRTPPEPGDELENE